MRFPLCITLPWNSGYIGASLGCVVMMCVMLYAAKTPFSHACRIGQSSQTIISDPRCPLSHTKDSSSPVRSIDRRALD